MKQIPSKELGLGFPPRRNSQNRPYVNHATRCNGFSLSEALVMLTLVCIAFVLMLQWYLYQPAEGARGPFHEFRSALHLAFGDTEWKSAQGAQLPGRVSDSGQPVSTIGADGALLQDSGEILLDEALPAGAPSVDAMDAGLRIQFGKGDTAVSIAVPGRYIVSSLPMGPDKETAEVHWFHPE